MRTFLTTILIGLLTLLQESSIGQNSVNMTLTDSSSIQLALRFTDTLLIGGDYTNALTLSQRILNHCQTNADTTGRNYKSGLEKSGLGHYYMGNYPLAIKLYRHALSLYSKTEREANAAAYAATQYRVGLAYHYLGQNDSALVWHMAALHAREALQPIDSNSLASSYNGIGMAFDALDQPDQALKWYGKSMKAWKSIKGYWNRNTANAYDNMGVTYHTTGRYDEALKYKLEALQIRQKVLGPDAYDTGTSWLNLGVSYSAIGHLSKSADALAETYRIWAPILPPNHPNLAFLMDNTGILLMDMGDFANAEKWLKDALKSRLDNYGYDSPEICKALTNLGVLAGKMADYSAAIDYQLKATYLFQKSAGNEYELMVAYSNIGVFYSDLEEYQNALVWLEKALKLSKKIESLPTDLITDIYYNIGIAHQGLHLYDRALAYKRKAINEAFTAFGVTNTHYIKYTEGLGHYYRDIKDYENAIIYFEYALQLRAKQAGIKSMDYAMVLIELAQVRLLAGYLEQVLPMIEQAEHIANYHNPKGASSDLRTWMRIKNLHAQYFQSRYEVDKRPENFEQAAALYNGMRDTFLFHLADMNGADSWKYWTNFIYPAFGHAISLYSGQYQRSHQKEIVAQAWLFSESAKSLLLLKAIQDDKLVHFEGVPDSLLSQERQNRVHITFLEKLRQEMIAAGKMDQDSMVLSVSSQISDYRQKAAQLRAQLNQHASQYVNLRYNLNQIPLAQVRATLVGKNQALLEYFVGDSSIYLFVVRPDTMIVQEVKRDFPLEDWIDGLRYGIYGFYAADKAIQTDSLKADAKRHYLEYAPKLYQKLVAPVAKHLPEKVILVPDGPLGYVPFDALLTGAPEDPNDFKSYPYLIQKHQFSYTYSATLLCEMRDKKHRKEPKKDFVAFAPFYNGDTSLLANMYAYDDLMRKDLQPLAFSGPEVAAASKLMRGETVVGAAATEERFTSMASDYRIIHLATHGRADNRVGDYAFLAFTEIKDSIENELLYVKDLYNLSLNADLVVLSACETGIGKLQRGEGIISLARAFAYAGAKSIVTSLWSVTDKSTSELMRLFYRELRQGKDKDEALRLARLRFLKESSVRNGHPFFWAAFVPVGDMRALR